RYTLDEPAIDDRFPCLDGIPAEPVRVLLPGRRHALELALSRPGAAPGSAGTAWTEAPGAGGACVEPWLGGREACRPGLG
ncbi:aldose epimerase, partial [Burkholderia pseudomallei]